MYEDAQTILDYLPIRRDAIENEYIEHLWQTFLILDGSQAMARPFAVMPFHLLFMLSVQYDVLKIAKFNEPAANLFFACAGGRNRDKLLNPQRSVFDVALITERTIPEIYRLVNFNQQDIKLVKDTIDNRNDRLAHARGGIEVNIENRIDQYLRVIEKVQRKMQIVLVDIFVKFVESDDIFGAGEDYFEEAGVRIEKFVLENNFSVSDIKSVIDSRLNLGNINTLREVHQKTLYLSMVLWYEVWSGEKIFEKEHARLFPGKSIVDYYKP